MGVHDELRRIQQEREERERESATWSKSLVGKYDTPIGLPPQELRSILDEARPLLKYDKKVIVGTGPDGITRVASSRTVYRLGLSKTIWNARCAEIPIANSDSDEILPWYLVIFQDREEVAPAYFANWLADYKRQGYYIDRLKLSPPEILARRLAVYIDRRF
jgi:hypothetical protein